MKHHPTAVDRMRTVGHAIITLQPIDSDADLEAFLAVRRAVLPTERQPTLAELKASLHPGDLLLLAELDGEVAGSGLANRSDTGQAHLAPRVLPDKRGRGVGSSVLLKLAEHAVQQGYARAGAHVAGDDSRSLAFATRHGFRETRRDIEQVLTLDGADVVPPEVEGVSLVSVAERPELLEEAYALAQQGYEDVPIAGLDIQMDAWLRDEATLPAGSFVALHDGEIVGYAGLMNWTDDPKKAVHGLTVVDRQWRGRGLATALKLRQIAWARANGLRQLVTYTQTGNENMRRVNDRLGYVTGAIDIAVARDLPLT
jgi:mycothiol synthase